VKHDAWSQRFKIAAIFFTALLRRRDLRSRGRTHFGRPLLKASQVRVHHGPPPESHHAAAPLTEPELAPCVPVTGVGRWPDALWYRWYDFEPSGIGFDRSSRASFRRISQKGCILSEIKFSKVIDRCPDCDGKNIERSRRSGAVEAVFCPLINFWPYRCKTCDLRFFGFSRLAAPLDAEARGLR
jgi:hypothetical protein